MLLNRKRDKEAALVELLAEITPTAKITKRYGLSQSSNCLGVKPKRRLLITLSDARPKSVTSRDLHC